MKTRIICILSVSLLLSAVLSGCAVKETNGSVSPSATVDILSQLQQKDAQIAAITTENDALKKQIKSLKSSTALSLALTVVNLLKDKDYAALSNYIHPTKGVRFSPYANVRIPGDIVMSAAQVAAFAGDSSTYAWGSLDGSGLPIEMIPSEYYSKFIYDVDFANPNMLGINNAIGKGTTPNNIDTAYPGDDFIEFHFTGFDPQFSGMDWKSLRLVFEDAGGTLFLVGIIHAQWTI
jgi:cell division protein FtsB